METLRFVDLFAGLGGFHQALASAGHAPVFASELDPELQDLYKQNFRGSSEYLVGDVNKHVAEVPKHDVLCAGFPCQPFSKSGAQLGAADKTRGTLFHRILEIADRRRPSWIMLENVGNFARHDKGNTWKVAKQALVDLGYEVVASEPKAMGGPGMLSPHHLGYPQHRERFFAVARTPNGRAPAMPVPNGQTSDPQVESIVQGPDELSTRDVTETTLPDQQVACINLWDEALRHLPDQDRNPPGPLWGDEFGASYPYEATTPHACTPKELSQFLWRHRYPPYTRKETMMDRLPNYARQEVDEFPHWKQQFIRHSRTWYQENKAHLPNGWLNRLRALPPSMRKLEWNCQGEPLQIWNQILQFRPSGLRAKKYNVSPALVAMTTTQVPILGRHQRSLTRIEGLRLQGFPDDHQLPKSRAAAFHALGNAVHVDVVRHVLMAQGWAPQPARAVHQAQTGSIEERPREVVHAA